jgi:hypothetical protein
MGKPKQQKPKRGRRAGAATADAEVQAGQISGGAVSLHQLFEQQTRRMLDRADLDEEQKQNLLVAMSCPCCGAGAMSYTIKLKR